MTVVTTLDNAGKCETFHVFQVGCDIDSGHGLSNITNQQKLGDVEPIRLNLVQRDRGNID